MDGGCDADSGGWEGGIVEGVLRWEGCIGGRGLLLMRRVGGDCMFRFFRLC
jgi:hypothetical protein